MKQTSLTIVAILLLLLSFFGIAATPDSFTLPRYLNASCKDYTGTWQGFITDPADLFGNGGAWPILVSLYEKEGHIIGQSTAINYAKKGGIIPVRKIWADCKDGVLTQIIWDDKTSKCGGVSQQGMLVSRNAMALRFNWENAMNGTSFMVFLKRVNSRYAYSVPSKPEAFVYGKRESCH